VSNLQFDACTGSVRLERPDATVVSLGDGLHDGQAETGAAGTAIARIVGAMETLEDAVRSSCGIPGPSSVTVNRTRPSVSASVCSPT
jgi:hypothetical protein